MNTRLHPVIALALLAAALAAPALGQTPATTSAPADREWGRSLSGLSVWAGPAGEWAAGGEMKLDCAIRNTGSAEVALPDKGKFFGYVLLAQGSDVYFTEKVFSAADLKDWLASLAAGGTIQLPTIDAGKLKAFAYTKDAKLVDGYPAVLADGKPKELAPAGAVADLLRAGTLKISYVAYLDRAPEKPLMLPAKVITTTVALGDFAKLPPAVQTRMLDDLAKRFGQDAFSAKTAHRDAVRIGAPAVATLAKILADDKAADFARMWAATALADIGGDAAADKLAKCLGDSLASVRYVAAYHGLKLNNAKFDAALDKAALAGADPMVTAWAIMGYLKFRKDVPAAILAAGVDNKEWKVRAAVVETIASGNPDRSHIPLLKKLAQDENPQIRAKAQEVLKQLGEK
jgi:hypothetical protein